MNFDPALLEDLLSGEKSICFFVSEGHCYWALDYRYNFALDAEKDYLGYLAKGHITGFQFEQACKDFRGGILKLTSGNFMRYLTNVCEGVFSSNELKTILHAEGESGSQGLLKRVEKFYLSGEKLNADELNFSARLVSRLPTFYVNFDRDIYMHLDSGRFHEDLAYPGWFSRCSDFSFLIPDKERYWALNGDYWKLRFI